MKCIFYFHEINSVRFPYCCPSSTPFTTLLYYKFTQKNPYFLVLDSAFINSLIACQRWFILWQDSQLLMDMTDKSKDIDSQLLMDMTDKSEDNVTEIVFLGMPSQKWVYVDKIIFNYFKLLCLILQSLFHDLDII